MAESDKGLKEIAEYLSAIASAAESIADELASIRQSLELVTGHWGDSAYIRVCDIGIKINDP